MKLKLVYATCLIAGAVAGVLFSQRVPPNLLHPMQQRILVDDCRCYFFDFGDIHRRIDKRAWVVFTCKDGTKWGTLSVEDGDALR